MAKLAAVTAGEAMTAPAVTVEPWITVAKAAATMTSRGMNRLPVVDDGRLVGIVTRADLVRAYVRSDEELAGTIKVEVLRQLLWLDPTAFTIEVRDGVATISGSVERRSTAEMIARTIAMVPGIVDVDASIRWQLEDRDIKPVERDVAFPYSPH
jgi:CBS domain-containing protein